MPCTGPTPQVLPLDAPRITGYLVALVVLRSLATEIALKAISYKRTQGIVREHACSCFTTT